MNMPSKKLRLSEVPGFVFDKTGVEPSKMTVYNWTNKGYKGVKLRYVLGRAPMTGFHMTRITAERWVEEFLAAYQQKASGK